MDFRTEISPTVGPQGASVVFFDSNKLFSSILVLALACGISIGLAVFAYSTAKNAEMETRMLEYYLLELDGKVIEAGIKKPEDSIASKLKKQRQEVEK